MKTEWLWNWRLKGEPCSPLIFLLFSSLLKKPHLLRCTRRSLVRPPKIVGGLRGRLRAPCICPLFEQTAWGGFFQHPVRGISGRATFTGGLPTGFEQGRGVETGCGLHFLRRVELVGNLGSLPGSGTVALKELAGAT